MWSHLGKRTVQSRDRQTFFVKGQIVNSLDLAGDTKAAIDNM